MVDKDRLAAPRDGQPLADLDRRQIDLGGRQRQRVVRRIEAVDKRPDRARGADCTKRRRRVRVRKSRRVPSPAHGHGKPAIAPHRPFENLVDSAAAPPGRRPPAASYTVEEAELCDRLPHKTSETPDKYAFLYCRRHRRKLRRASGLIDLRLALFEPDIPQNTGALLRLAACFGVGVDLIEPLGFLFDDRRLRRAALDYAALVDGTPACLVDAFRGRARPRLAARAADHRRRRPAARFAFAAGDTLLLGRESAGVPDFVHRRGLGAGRHSAAPPAPARSTSRWPGRSRSPRRCARRVNFPAGFPYSRRMPDDPSLSLSDPEPRERAAVFATLRDRICAEFEAIEDEFAAASGTGPAGRFVRSSNTYS